MEAEETEAGVVCRADREAQAGAEEARKRRAGGTKEAERRRARRIRRRGGRDPDGRIGGGEAEAEETWGDVGPGRIWRLGSGQAGGQEVGGREDPNWARQIARRGGGEATGSAAQAHVHLGALAALARVALCNR